MKRTINGGGGGLDWLDDNKLADLDFADDILLYDETWSGMQQLIKKIEDVASIVGIHINAGKTKLMLIIVFDDKEVNTIQAEGGELESVEEFCYFGSVVLRDSSLRQRH